MEPEFLEKETHSKGWGEEEWLVNNNKYCCKFLNFNKGKKFSMHYHLIKDETWIVLEGSFNFRWINQINAKVMEKEIKVGDIIRIRPNTIHQLESLEESKIIEVSTRHFEEDSYRVFPGDSQIKLQ